MFEQFLPGKEPEPEVAKPVGRHTMTPEELAAPINALIAKSAGNDLELADYEGYKLGKAEEPHQEASIKVELL